MRRQAGEAASAAEYAARYGISTSGWNVSTPNRLAASAATPRSVQRDATSTKGVETLDDVEVTNLLPGFQIVHELGRGAFGRVFLARQLDLANRLVVLKVSTESFAEADKMAQLQHAHIVPIYSVHRAGQLFVVCMPYFGATTLADLIGKLGDSQMFPVTGVIVADTVRASAESTYVKDRHRPLTPKATGPTAPARPTELREPIEIAGADPLPFLKTLRRLSYAEAVLTIGARLADGLRHAHERGIIHRDLKPANVLLADDGRPMLLDFNLSEDLKPGMMDIDPIIGGTLPYMAPEQLDAFQSRQTARDPRSDLFSMGVILYELLTGRQPFPVRSGKLDDILLALIADRKQSPQSLRQLNPAVSPAIAAIVHRCLEYDPQSVSSNSVF